MNTATLSDFIKWAKSTDLQELICEHKDIYVEVRTAETSFNSYSVALTQVKAPAVGFYHKNHGMKRALLKEGQILKKGQFLGCIEMNKTTCDIICPKSGKLKAISVKEKTAVEYAQPLFFID